jgi:ABC-type transport system substrate-binding protein
MSLRAVLRGAVAALALGAVFAAAPTAQPAQASTFTWATANDILGLDPHASLGVDVATAAHRNLQADRLHHQPRDAGETSGQHPRLGLSYRLPAMLEQQGPALGCVACRPVPA